MGNRTRAHVFVTGKVQGVYFRAVDHLVEFCHEGSEAAEVEAVDVTDEEPEGEDGFRVRW